MDNIFGKVVRQKRHSLGKNLKEMAEALSCSIAYCSDIERGRRNPPVGEKLSMLADFLGVEFCEFQRLAKQEEIDINIKLGNFCQTNTNFNDLNDSIYLASKISKLPQEAINAINLIIKENS